MEQVGTIVSVSVEQVGTIVRYDQKPSNASTLGSTTWVAAAIPVNTVHWNYYIFFREGQQITYLSWMKNKVSQPSLTLTYLKMTSRLIQCRIWLVDCRKYKPFEIFLLIWSILCSICPNPWWVWWIWKLSMFEPAHITAAFHGKAVESQNPQHFWKLLWRVSWMRSKLPVKILFQPLMSGKIF